MDFSNLQLQSATAVTQALNGVEQMKRESPAGRAAQSLEDIKTMLYLECDERKTADIEIRAITEKQYKKSNFYSRTAIIISIVCLIISIAAFLAGVFGVRIMLERNTSDPHTQAQAPATEP